MTRDALRDPEAADIRSAHRGQAERPYLTSRAAIPHMIAQDEGPDCQRRLGRGLSKPNMAVYSARVVALGAAIRLLPPTQPRQYCHSQWRRVVSGRSFGPVGGDPRTSMTAFGAVRVSPADAKTRGSRSKAMAGAICASGWRCRHGARPTPFDCTQANQGLLPGQTRDQDEQ